MAAKELPKEWPPLVVKEFSDVKRAYRSVRDIVRSVEDLRKRLVETLNDHATLIDIINVQVVNVQDGALATGSTQLPFNDTIPQNNEGDEVMTLVITPNNTANILIIIVVVNLANSVANLMSAALFQDSVAGALASAQQEVSASDDPQNMKFIHKMSAGTVSATTFKVRIGGNSVGTTTFNGRAGGRIHGGVMASSITILEITA